MDYYSESNATVVIPPGDDDKGGFAISHHTLEFTLVIVVLFVGILFWLVSPSRARRQPLPLTTTAVPEEEQEQRQKFVERHLESREWRNDSEEFINAGSKGSGDAKEGINYTMSDTCSCGDSVSSCRPECPVCLAPFENGDSVSSSSNIECQHVFHRECVYEWLLKKKECPMCRNIFLIEPEEEEIPAPVSPATDVEDDTPIRGQRNGSLSWQWCRIVYTAPTVTPTDEEEGNTAPPRNGSLTWQWFRVVYNRGS